MLGNLPLVVQSDVQPPWQNAQSPLAEVPLLHIEETYPRLSGRMSQRDASIARARWIWADVSLPSPASGSRKATRTGTRVQSLSCGAVRGTPAAYPPNRVNSNSALRHGVVVSQGRYSRVG